MKINNIEFDIKNVSVSKSYNNIGYGNVNYHIPIYDEIRISATTDNKFLFALDNWFNQSLNAKNSIKIF